MKKIFVLSILVMSVSRIILGQTDDELRKAFREQIEIENAGSSIVMVEVSEKGTRFVSYGKQSKNTSSANADEKTIYEIGSITKVFTGILLAESIKRGEVKLDDPISKYLPKSVKAPTFDGKEITLLHLATHSSALPRLPGNLAPKDGLNPYVDYKRQNLYDFLSGYELNKEIGTSFEYSNLGVGLLGHILSLRTKMPFEQLITIRILKPLGMNDTSIVLPPAKKSRHAQGFNRSNEPTPNWEFDVLAGAGALRSTSADMAKFIAANIGLTKTPLSQSLAEALKMRQQAQSPNSKIGLCWSNANLSGREVFWHNGGTGGFMSFLAIDPKQKKGAFLVMNSANMDVMKFLQSVAFNSLEKQIPIEKVKASVSLSVEILEKYVGEYQITPSFSIVVTREGQRLFAQATGQGNFEVYAEKEDEFFAKAAPISLSFKKDAGGKVIELIIRQGGRNTPAKRLN